MQKYRRKQLLDAIETPYINNFYSTLRGGGHVGSAFGVGTPQHE